MSASGRCQVLFLAAVVLLAYFPAWHGGFIWDDVTFIVDNDLIHAPNGLWRIWFSKESTDYWPLTYSLLWIFWRVFGIKTLGYHLVNLTLHIVNSVLAWKIFERLGLRFAFVAALLFALHPVNVEAVAWIFQLKTLLATSLALGTFWFWMDFVGGNRRAYWPALGLFALGLLAKASIVTWPFVLLGYLYWKSAGIGREDVKRLAPFFLIALAVGGLNCLWYPYGQLTGGEVIRADTWLERGLGTGAAFWFYLAKAWLPIQLSFIYPRWHFDVSDVRAYLPTAALVVAVAVFWRMRRRWKFSAAAFFYVLIVLIPVLGFVDIYFMRYSLVADHWQYLALPGVCAAAVGLFGRWKYLLFACLPVLFCLTFMRAGVYADEEAIWRDTLKQNPAAWLAENNLGVWLLEHGNGVEALSHFENVMRMNPAYADAYLNAGVYYLEQGNLTLARQYFERTLEVFPFQARALNNLAALALRDKDANAAIHDLELAVAHLPTYTMGYKNLGILYVQTHQRDKAIEVLQKALRLRPDDEDVRRNLRLLSPQDAPSQ